MTPPRLEQEGQQVLAVREVDGSAGVDVLDSSAQRRPVRSGLQLDDESQSRGQPNVVRPRVLPLGVLPVRGLVSVAHSGSNVGGRLNPLMKARFERGYIRGRAVRSG